MKNKQRRIRLSFIVSILLVFSLGTIAGAVRQDASPPTIIFFTATPGTVTVEEAESNQKLVELSWHSVGVSEAHRLEIQVYDLDAWVTRLPTAKPDAEPLPAIGARTIPVKHPADFGPPAYRLLILDETGQVLDEQLLTIPYTKAEAAPQIERFTTGATELDIEVLRAQPASITVNWSIANRTPTSNLVFEQVLDDARVVSIEKPRPTLWVPSEGQGPVTVFAPDASDDSLTLRLRLVDIVSGEVLDEQTQSIKLVEETTGSSQTSEPAGDYILSFTTETEILDGQALTDGTARAIVAWQVIDRPANTNLVFEQLVPDGDAVSVELPREETLVTSAGRGEVAPMMPPNDTGNVTLRLRLVELETGETLDERSLQIAIDRPTELPFTILPTPTASAPQPTETGAQAEIPKITTFAATPNIISQGSPVTLRWEVGGANRVTLAMLNPLDKYTDVKTSQSTNGTWEITLPAIYEGVVTFRLTATGPNGEQASAQTSVTVACRYIYFFPPPDEETTCPTSEATTTPALFQVFESGYMVWREDTNDVYVIAIESNRAMQYDNLWTEDEPATPDIDETPPDGYLVPEDAFGKVWAENDSVRTALGWATGQPETYTMQTQASENRTYFTWPTDSRVLYIADETWSFVK